MVGGPGNINSPGSTRRERGRVVRRWGTRGVIEGFYVRTRNPLNASTHLIQVRRVFS